MLSSYLNRNTKGLVTHYMNNINGGNKRQTIKKLKKFNQQKTRSKKR